MRCGADRDDAAQSAKLPLCRGGTVRHQSGNRALASRHDDFLAALDTA